MTPIELCETIATKLSAAQAGSPMPSAVIVADIAPAYDLADLEETQVAVAPFSRASTAAARRGVSAREVVVAIGISRRAKVLADGKIDRTKASEFLAFVEWIDEHLESLRQIGPYSWTASDVNPLFDSDVLNDRFVFQSYVSVTYRVVS